MMLRSSSTPVLGSLHSSSSHSESPTNHENNKNSPSSEVLKKISFSHGGSSTFIKSFSCRKGFRRAQSDGNLEGLAAASCGGGGGGDIQDFSTHFSSNLSPFRSSVKRTSMLQSVPSLSVYNCKGEYEEDGIENDGFLERSVTIGETIMSMGSGEFTFGEKMGLIEEWEEDKFQYLDQDDDDYMNPSLFLARGLGIDINGGGGGGGFNFAKSAEGGAENEDEIEEYYKKMVEQNPCSSLFLRNYAQFLHKAKGDLKGADEYYSRAILADPRDGDILSQYARLVWEMHHDYEKACSYFERAVQAAPEDSHVHAAYASFL